jgi:hypothetical protein
MENIDCGLFFNESLKPSRYKTFQKTPVFKEWGFRSFSLFVHRTAGILYNRPGGRVYYRLTDDDGILGDVKNG